MIQLLMDSCQSIEDQNRTRSESARRVFTTDN